MREIFVCMKDLVSLPVRFLGGDIKEDEKMKESVSLCPARMDERENWKVFNFK